MSDKINKKYNDSCVKLFEFIKMLYDDNADFKKVIELFSDGEYDGTSNTHVTLNKYLNTLKIFGIKVKKENGKYKLLSSLYKIPFNYNDIKSIALLKKGEELLLNDKNKNCLEDIINSLEIRFDENAQNISQISINKHINNIKFYQSKMVDQIKLCEKYCQDNQKLEIVFINDKHNEINLLCSPIELIYQKCKINLKVMGNNGSRIYEIPLESIKSIKQLPTTSNSLSIPTTVVFKIKNRLALNYKLRDWERLERIETNGNKIIINKNEDFEILLKRLMKYGTECEIISPKFIKEEMIDLINKTLENY